MDIKKRKTAGKVIRVREPTPSESDSDSDSAKVVRPGDNAEKAFTKKRKREDTNGKDSTEKEQEDFDSLAALAEKPSDTAKEAPKLGPVKSQSAVRMTTFTDYAPDVCKDYKKTGFCGFGDSCKFAHMREEFKQGWALDEEHDKANKNGTVKPSGTVISSAAGRRQGISNDAERDLDDEEKERRMLEKIPFNCTICEGAYKDPIVTRCGHYFCEKCAMDRYKRNPNCAICGAGTSGVFNYSRQLKDLLKKKKEREEKKAAAT
jgi:RING finger protein 113A